MFEVAQMWNRCLVQLGSIGLKMKTKAFLAGFLCLLTAAWAWDALYSHPATGDMPWVLRLHGLYLTGVWSIGLMSLAMILATRPAWLEVPLGGMDKIYHLHKWSGILAIACGGAHWLIKMAGDPLTALFSREGRPARDAVLSFMLPLRSQAKDLGEIAIYLLLGLLALALWKRFPYRPWRLQHKTMPIIHLAVAFHVIALMPLAYWSGPTGVLLAVLLAGGVFADGICLAQRIGSRRRHSGTIETVVDRGGILEVTCNPGSTWRGHRPGQFAFVTFDCHEGAHPFTIANASSTDSNRIIFEIKALGDYTSSLARRLRARQPVIIEGPYGCMDWQLGREDAEQVWVAGGIGVTPFLAWLESMQHISPSIPITMHYCVHNAASDPFIERIEQLCAQLPNVRVHVHDSTHGDRLDSEKLVVDRRLPNGKMDLWFCGPSGLAKVLAPDLKKLLGRGFRIHQEVFEMR